MKTTTLLKIVIGVVLLVFWFFLSNTLTQEPNLTTFVIPFSYGLLAVVAIIIQLFLKKDMQTRMKEALDSEIEEEKINCRKRLLIYQFILLRGRFPITLNLGSKNLLMISKNSILSSQNILFNPRLSIQQY